jgi:putative membrane protein
MKKTYMALALSILLSIVAPAHAHGPDSGTGPGGMMGPGMMGWGYGMGWLWSIIMLLFWIAVLVGIVFLVRWLILSTGRKGQGAAPEESAVEILKRRYARGEITKEEFERIKKDIA